MNRQTFKLFKIVYQTKTGNQTLYVWDTDKSAAGRSFVLRGRVSSKMITPRVNITEVTCRDRMVFKRIK